MKESSNAVNPVAGAFVVTLCVVTIVLICLLPFESLVVDLVYQGF
jgi:hypothetical protein